MKPQLHRSRPLGGFGLILSASILAACAGGGAPASAGPSTGPLPSTAATEAAPATPAPTNLLTMAIALLPTATVDASKVKVACDDATAGTAASLTCDDIVALTARIAATMSANPIEQVSVTKPADNPDAIQVTFWVKPEEGEGLTAFTSTIDPAGQTVTFPIEDPDAVFPAM